MTIQSRNIDLVKRAAKKLKKARPEMKLCGAQEMVTRIFGYKGWYEFIHVCKNDEKTGSDIIRMSPAPGVSKRAILASRLSREIELP